MVVGAWHCSRLYGGGRSKATSSSGSMPGVPVLTTKQPTFSKWQRFCILSGDAGPPYNALSSPPSPCLSSQAIIMSMQLCQYGWQRLPATLPGAWSRICGTRDPERPHAPPDWHSLAPVAPDPQGPDPHYCCPARIKQLNQVMLGPEKARVAATQVCSLHATLPGSKYSSNYIGERVG